ncbi:MAG TPA: hypothetical protein VF736_04470 [Pyrinomonadaceae bacterium]|jgi:hypothetical protein
MLQRTTVFTALACWLTLTCSPAPAQSRADSARPPRQPAAPAGAAAAAAPDSLAEAERATAVALVLSLAGGASDYRDPSLRVLILARAADALWGSDRAQSRSLFYRAWEAAEGVDGEGRRRAREARKEFLARRARGSVMIAPAPNLRAEVLKLASRRSRELAEEFLQRLDEAQEKESKEEAASSFSDPTEPPDATARRLELARQLLEGGDAERAVLFAKPALGAATSPGIIFLASLRQKEPALADDLYAALLRRAAADPAADATTVSLLSAYVFSPSVLVTATRNGRLSNQWAESLPAPALPAELHAYFFRVAAQILMRPLPQPEQDHTSAGRTGTYFTVARLLPLFERHAPEQVPALKALLATLTRDVPAQYQGDREGMLTVGLAPPADDGSQDPLRLIGSAASPAERDSAYAKAARSAALGGDPRAREYAEKIGDALLQRRVLAFVDFALLRDAVGKRKVEEAVRLLRAEGLEPLQRVWGYAEVASLSKRTSPARAAELLDSAVGEARRIEEGRPERVYALTAAAAQLVDLDRARCWEILAEAVRAANKVNDFTGNDGKVESRLDAGGGPAVLKVEAPSFNLEGVFAALALDDLQRAAALANTLTAEYPRALSTLAVARAVLERKPPGAH